MTLFYQELVCCQFQQLVHRVLQADGTEPEWEITLGYDDPRLPEAGPLYA